MKVPANKSTPQFAPRPAAPQAFEGQGQPPAAAHEAALEPDVPASQDPEDAPVQVDRAVFLAARLRETLLELANSRSNGAELLSELAILRKENAAFRAGAAQAEVNSLDQEYEIVKGTVLQKRQDGTYWRLPTKGAQQS